MQAAIRALGTVDSIDVSTGTVRDTSLTILIGAINAPAANTVSGNTGYNPDVV